LSYPAKNTIHIRINQKNPVLSIPCRDDAVVRSRNAENGVGMGRSEMAFTRVDRKSPSMSAPADARIEFEDRLE
jgi:hypothetical protein